MPNFGRTNRDKFYSLNPERSLSHILLNEAVNSEDGSKISPLHSPTTAISGISNFKHVSVFMGHLVGIPK